MMITCVLLIFLNLFAAGKGRQRGGFREELSYREKNWGFFIYAYCFKSDNVRGCEFFQNDKKKTN